MATHNPEECSAVLFVVSDHEGRINSPCNSDRKIEHAACTPKGPEVRYSESKDLE
jgi:hypothetical protein